MNVAMPANTDTPKAIKISFVERLCKLGTLWTIILIIVAIIVIVLLLRFLFGVLVIAPVGLEFINHGTTMNTALPIFTDV